MKFKRQTQVQRQKDASRINSNDSDPCSPQSFDDTMDKYEEMMEYEQEKGETINRTSIADSPVKPSHFEKSDAVSPDKLTPDGKENNFAFENQSRVSPESGFNIDSNEENCEAIKSPGSISSKSSFNSQSLKISGSHVTSPVTPSATTDGSSTPSPSLNSNTRQQTLSRFQSPQTSSCLPQNSELKRDDMVETKSDLPDESGKSDFDSTISEKEISSTCTNIVNKTSSRTSGDFQGFTNSQSGNCHSNQEISSAKQRISPHERLTNTNDSFYQPPASESDFPGGPTRYPLNEMANEGFSIMDNYSQETPNGVQASLSPKDGFAGNFGPSQIAVSKSNQTQTLAKSDPLTQQQRRYHFAENSSQCENSFKYSNYNSQFQIPGGNFDINANTFHPAHGYSRYNNGLRTENSGASRSIVAAEYGNSIPAIKHAPFSQNQLNPYQASIYYDGNYSAGYHSGVNRTIDSTAMSQQNYPGNAPYQQASFNMAAVNGHADQFNEQAAPCNGNSSDFSSIFSEFYGMQTHGYQAIH